MHVIVWNNHCFVKVQDENSITRQRKAAILPKSTKEDFLAILGDYEDQKYPIYMSGNSY